MKDNSEHEIKMQRPDQERMHEALFPKSRRSPGQTYKWLPVAVVHLFHHHHLNEHMHRGCSIAATSCETWEKKIACSLDTGKNDTQVTVTNDIVRQNWGSRNKLILFHTRMSRCPYIHREDYGRICFYRLWFYVLKLAMWPRHPA